MSLDTYDVASFRGKSPSSFLSLMFCMTCARLTHVALNDGITSVQSPRAKLHCIPSDCCSVEIKLYDSPVVSPTSSNNNSSTLSCGFRKLIPALMKF